VAVTADEALAALTPAPDLVVLMCGLAGSGKTTFSQRLDAKGFARLSIDELVWSTAGRFGLDYAAADYPRQLEAARAVLRDRLVALMTARTPTVVDSAFWNRAARDDYRALIAEHGCDRRLVYLRVEPETLRARLRDRSRRFDANAAFEVTPQMLDRFIAGFEAPSGEGEIVVDA
jgi:predicted kinase